VDAKRVVWAAIVAGFLAIAVAGPVAIAREAGRSGAEAAPASGAPAPGAAPVVRMENIAFTPGTLTVRPGTEVVFENRDVAPHTVTASGAGIDSGTINPGRSFRLVVTRPFDYVCTIHPSMRAKLLLSG
jgi:plastocyanin